MGTEEEPDGPRPDCTVWPPSCILGPLGLALLQAPTYALALAGISTFHDDTHFLPHLFMKISHVSSFQKLGLLVGAALLPTLVADETPRSGLLGVVSSVTARRRRCSQGTVL